MTTSCDQARQALALGLDESAESHLGECAACRLEAARVGQVVRALAESAEIAPPAALDVRVRRSLAASPPSTRPLPSLLTASGLAISAYASIVLGVGIWLASSGLAETAPALTAAMAASYLAACAAASLPLLIKRTRPAPAELQEVRS
jgi:predicted anti-sigma-YlaC factor YlaD